MAMGAVSDWTRMPAMPGPAICDEDSLSKVGRDHHGPTAEAINPNSGGEIDQEVGEPSCCSEHGHLHH
jgi:hypothetical protein